jgi:sterol desaturase/sphingolipid hydroxylase (fatty acid hydroxylase superfamily)
MTFEDLIPILLPVTFVVFLILERLAPARPQPRVRRWLAKGIAFFVLCAALNAVIPAAVMMKLGGYSVFHLHRLGTVGGALLMLLVSDFVGYAVHRGLHTSERIWRWTHQLHHSAERMDMAGSSFFHPFDILLQQILPGLLVVLLLGVSPGAAALGGLFGFFFGVSPHLNIRTPAWLGYVFQRPEMHAIHHQRGVHAYNYGVLAFSDLVFGTWRNPTTFPQEAFGFWDGASGKLGAMLVGRDVSRARTPQLERA